MEALDRGYVELDPGQVESSERPLIPSIVGFRVESNEIKLPSAIFRSEIVVWRSQLQLPLANLISIPKKPSVLLK